MIMMMTGGNEDDAAKDSHNDHGSFQINNSNFSLNLYNLP